MQTRPHACGTAASSASSNSTSLPETNPLEEAPRVNSLFEHRVRIHAQRCYCREHARVASTCISFPLAATLPCLHCNADASVRLMAPPPTHGCTNGEAIERCSFNVQSIGDRTSGTVAWAQGTGRPTLPRRATAMGKSRARASSTTSPATSVCCMPSSVTATIKSGLSGHVIQYGHTPSMTSSPSGPARHGCR